MKKIFASLLTLMLVLTVFVGCDSKKDEQKQSEQKKETLIMATNAEFPPYEYLDDNGNFAGIDIEIAEAIADKLGMELKINDVEFGSIVTGVQSGKYHIGIAGITVSADRLEQVNFSESYANGVQVVIVPEDSEYASFEDFYASWTGEGDDKTPATIKDGIKIGVQQDTTGDIYSSDTPKNWGFGDKNVIRYSSGADAVQALLTGKVTAVIIDNEPAKSFVAANQGLKILQGEYTNEDYAICVNKNNTELLEKINNALSELRSEGKLDEIVAKYIK